MQQISKDILENYQIRKTAKQKARFAALMQKHYPSLRVEEGGLIKSRNLVIGDPDSADIFFTAHYDTCAALPVPNFIAPNNPLLSILYSLAIALPFLLLMSVASAVLSAAGLGFWWRYFISLALLLALLVLVFFVGVPNRRNANDNTSGVITLLEIMESLEPEELERCCFVLFDNEESGLLGSALFKKMHKAAAQQKLLINFDCVSDGEHLLLVPSAAAAEKYGGALSKAYAGTKDLTLNMGRRSTMYPSDQLHFRFGVGAAFLKHKRFLGLYLTRIHTKRDTVFMVRNIEHLVECSKNLLSLV